MYKETLDVLMEGINEPFKRAILENQLHYHFTDKTEENKNAMDCSVGIVRRILENFDITKIVGVQPIKNDNSVVISGGIEYITTPNKRVFQARFPILSIGNEIEAEINEALAGELEFEITNKILETISENIIDSSKISISYGVKESKITANILKKKIKELDANWIVAPPSLISILQASGNFESKYGKSAMCSGAALVGWFNGNINTYSSIMHDVILIGYKDPNSEDAPIVYAPETIMNIGNIQNDGFDEYFNLYTKDAIVVNNDIVKKRFAKISIETK